jgi:sugar phosphate isomerase/epimerase
LRLTCSSLSLYSAPAEEAIRTIAELGFPALDLVGIPTFPNPHLDVARRDSRELHRLSQLVGRAGVEVATVVTVPSDGLDYWEPAEIDARVGWAVEACTSLGSGRLVLDAGNPVAVERPDRSLALERWKAMIDSAFEATSRARVSLAVEMPHTGTLAERFDQVAELLALIARPDIGVDYDTSHVHRSGASLEESMRAVGDRIVKVALRDVDADGEFCRPGKGQVDFPELVAVLHARGYDGDLVIELETPGVETSAAQRSEVELARAYIEGILVTT